MASCDMILEEERDHELKVTFYPPLYLQRKIWVLDVMRREGIVDVRLPSSKLFLITIIMIYR